MSRCFLHVFSTFEPGGMETRATRIMDLLPLPHRHVIVAMSGRTTAITRIGRAAVELQPAPAVRGFVATARAMARRVRELRPDLVLTYNWGAIETVLGCRLAGHRALVHHEEGFGAQEIDRLLRRRTWARRWLLRRAAAVVVPSAQLAKIAASTWRLPPARVRHLPNGVDLERYRPRARRDAALVVVGGVAHFRPEKDVPALIEAFARCRERQRARLLLIGDGPDLAAAQALARQRGVDGSVEFRGPVADTAAVYQEFDVFALSSRTEQMPLVVLEAMACGLPVVAPEVGDVLQMVAPANRALVTRRGDLDALAAALDRTIASASLRAEAGAANRARCEELYDQRACLQAHLDLYAEVLGDAL